MPDEIKVGDVVQLKSGGPAMTVEDAAVISDSQVQLARCVWFDPSATTALHDNFPLAGLQKSSGSRGAAVR